MLPSEEIKEKINIVDLINEYVPLKKAGVNFRAVCPFHQEKTPSFMVSPTKQIWHCFGCQLGGDHFEFIKQIEGVEFPEALEILAARAGITLRKSNFDYGAQKDQKNTLLAINDLAAKFYAKILSDSPRAQDARNYLLGRGFKDETIKNWQLGYAIDDFHAFENFIIQKGFQKKEAAAAGLLVEKDGEYYDRFRNRVMFPIFDIHGRVVGFTGRILDENTPLRQGSGGPPAKYINSPETLIYNKSQVIYGLHLAKTEIRKKNEAIVVEGNVDVITCHEAGYGNVVGTSGTALTSRQLEILKRFTDNIVFAFDIDEAGLSAAKRAVELALQSGFNVRLVTIPKDLAKDPDELIRKNPEIWGERVKSAKGFLDFYFEAVFARIDLTTNVGKKQAARELLPLIALLPNPIDRHHYLESLARQIRVDEKILTELLNSSQPQLKSREPQQSRINRKSKQAILERRVLGLFLKFASNLASDWQNLKEEDFQDPTLKDIFRTVSGQVGTDNFDLESLKSANPKLAQEIQLLIFATENELAVATDWNLEQAKNKFLADLKREALKQRMNEIVLKITRAERGGRIDEAKTLSGEFNNLIQELARYG